MDDVAAWIGREQAWADIVSRHRVAGLMALLDHAGPLPDVLPPLGHWLLAPFIARQSELDVDGHPRRGGDALLPPITLPRRMWAASEVSFIQAIPLGEAIVRHSKVAAIEPKTGRSGAMIFVTLDHDICYEGVTAIRERQHIVYREAAAHPRLPAPAERPSEPQAEDSADATATYVADPVALFRYSALTFNGHRIHYDRDHAEAEGYPNLVVHGPLLATLLLDHARRQRPGAAVSRFAFRAQSPVFADQPFTLAQQGDRLRITDTHGVTAMTAEIDWA